MQTEQKITQIISDMQFERRRPVSRTQRASYAALQKEVGEIRKGLNALYLRLWHAEQKRDYHSLSLHEARSIIAELNDRMSALYTSIEEKQ